MAFAENLLNDRRPRVVGSFGSLLDLRSIAASAVRESCDLAEIRLDLLVANGEPLDPSAWSHLTEIPLLFTARRSEEGGALPLTPAARIDLLQMAITSAAWIDVEVASLHEMNGLLTECANREIPWIASYHDFDRLPATEDLKQAAQRAKERWSSSSPRNSIPPAISHVSPTSNWQITASAWPPWAWDRWRQFLACSALSAAACLITATLETPQPLPGSGTARY